MRRTSLSRRTFLALAGVAPLASRARAVSEGRPAHVPVGLELYSLRAEEERDRKATLRAVAEMGYEGVEFWGPYFEWTAAYAREIRKELDGLGLRCFSTHTRAPHYAEDAFTHVIELNQILGSGCVVMAHPGEVEGLDGWKRVAAVLSKAYETLRPLGIGAGFHNHLVEFKPVEGTRPIDVLTAGTPPGFHLQLDTGTCLAAGADPLAFVRANPGRVRSYHLKDWSPDPQKGYQVLLGEGIGPWKELFEVAETVGGVEYYLVEQEGSRFPPLETARRCLETFRAPRKTPPASGA